MNHKEFLFLLCSSRYEGNTELLARRAARKLPNEANQRWLRLIEFPLAAFEDIRHDETRNYELVSENEKTLHEATLSATDLVIASPLYWYSLSASAKLYLDYWSGWMRLPETHFRNRMVGKKNVGDLCVKRQRFDRRGKTAH